MASDIVICHSFCSVAMAWGGKSSKLSNSSNLMTCCSIWNPTLSLKLFNALFAAQTRLTVLSISPWSCQYILASRSLSRWGEYPNWKWVRLPYKTITSASAKTGSDANSPNSLLKWFSVIPIGMGTPDVDLQSGPVSNTLTRWICAPRVLVGVIGSLTVVSVFLGCRFRSGPLETDLFFGVSLVFPKPSATAGLDIHRLGVLILFHR